MSISECLSNAVAGGEISKDEARRVEALYEGFRRRGDPAAKEKTAARLSAEADEAERRVRIAAEVHSRIGRDIDSYRTATGQKDVGEGAIQLIEHFGSAPYASLEGRRKAIIGRAHSRMEEVLETFRRTKLAGKTPNKARLENVVRELFGEGSGDSGAKALADAFTDTAEWLRQRFNAAGGSIAKLEGWGLPQAHDARALLKAGRDTWKTTIRPMLDPRRMRNPLTDEPILEDELDGILDEVWSAIVTDGWSKREPSKAPFGKGALASQHAEHRFLVFRDADSWLAYQRDFGQGDPFAAMMNHVNLMARDISALEILGPNPNATVEWLKQTIQKEGAAAIAGQESRLAKGLGSPISRANRKALTLDRMWKAARGASESPVTGGLAMTAGGLRNWVTASVLGSATLGAVTSDPIFQATARRFAGLPVTKQLHSLAKGVSGMSRRESVRAGLILDSAMHQFSTQARYVGILSGPEWTNWLTDRVLTASGLTPFTQGSRHSFGLDFMATMADQTGKAFKDVEPALRRTMGRYGLGEAEWEAIRKASLFDADGEGSTFLRPNEIAEVDERLAERYLEMILQETEYAVPSTTLRGRVTLVSADQPGTLFGELKRSGALFKSFGTTFALLYGGRLWRETAASPARGAAYAGAILATTTFGGMWGVWLKDITSGRDPRPIFDENGNPLPFMAAAFLQGGGFGIWGDFLFADLNRYGGGLAGTATGPVVERGTDFLNLTLGNLVQLAAGEDTGFWEEGRRFASGMIPGSTLWYLKIAYQRVLMDQLEQQLDPKANGQFKARQRYWQKNFGTDHWWRPGETTPRRAPDLSTIGASR